MSDLWVISEDFVDPQKQHHKETIFTTGNGYLSTRGAFEEGILPTDGRHSSTVSSMKLPLSSRSSPTLPDWLPLTIYLNGERFSLDTGTIESFSRTLDLRTGLLTRVVRWRSPAGMAATLTFERFASLADEHLLFIRCRVTPEFTGTVEFRVGLNGNMHNDGLVHWQWVEQGKRDAVVYLHNRTRKSGIDIATAMQIANVRAANSSARNGMWKSANPNGQA